MSAAERPPSAPERSLAAIFGIPLGLALLTIFGLSAALIGEGPWHVASWIALAVPLAITAWCLRPGH